MSEIKPKVMKKYEYYMCYSSGSNRHDVFCKSDIKPLGLPEQIGFIKERPFVYVYPKKEKFLLEYFLEVCKKKKILVFKKEEYSTEQWATEGRIYFGTVLTKEELISLEKPAGYKFGDTDFKEEVEDTAKEIKRPNNRAVLTTCSNIYKLGRYDKVLDKDFNQVWPPLPTKNKQR